LSDELKHRWDISRLAKADPPSLKILQQGSLVVYSLVVFWCHLRSATFVGRDLKTAPLNAIPAPSFENRHKFIFEKQLEKINDFIRTAKFAAFELVGFLGRLKLPF
jgi:hypothetical protein